MGCWLWSPHPMARSIITLIPAHTYILTHTLMLILAHTHTCTDMHIHSCIITVTHAYICTHTQAHKNVLLYTNPSGREALRINDHSWGQKDRWKPKPGVLVGRLLVLHIPIPEVPFMSVSRDFQVLPVYRDPSSYFLETVSTTAQSRSWQPCF